MPLSGTIVTVKQDYRYSDISYLALLSFDFLFCCVQCAELIDTYAPTVFELLATWLVGTHMCMCVCSFDAWVDDVVCSVNHTSIRSLR